MILINSMSAWKEETIDYLQRTVQMVQEFKILTHESQGYSGNTNGAISYKKSPDHCSA